MNGMQLSDFLKKIAAGDEIEFVFHNKTYFYQGYYENDQYVSTVDCWDEEHKSEFDGYCSLLRRQKSSMAKLFLMSKMK